MFSLELAFAKLFSKSTTSSAIGLLQENTNNRAERHKSQFNFFVILTTLISLKLHNFNYIRSKFCVKKKGLHDCNPS